MEIATTPVHASLFSGPGAWTGDESKHASEFVYHFRSEILAEIDAVVRERREKPNDLTRDGPWTPPSFKADAAELRNELRTGRGFVVLRGLPLDRYSEEEATGIYWELGTLFGSPLPQNARGDLLYSVRDEGHVNDYGAPRLRVQVSKTRGALNFHTDGAPAWMGATPDVLGLFALRTARSGGASVLVSGQAVHNLIFEERPDCLARLYQAYYFDRTAETRPGDPAFLRAPVFRFDGSLAVRYFRYYITQGHAQAGVPLKDADLEALDVLEGVVNRPELQAVFEMEAGDIQFVSNFFVFHSRTAYEDHPEPERKRHLKRMWISFD
jgi:alpha-ketoglutarate-dependent taurine dioxygenase